MEEEKEEEVERELENHQKGAEDKSHHYIDQTRRDILPFNDIPRPGPVGAQAHQHHRTIISLRIISIMMTMILMMTMMMMILMMIFFKLMTKMMKLALLGGWKQVSRYK